MAIAATDIIFRLSTTAGAAGDSTAGTPAGSLGKYVSTTAMGTGAGALFDDVTGAENAANDVEYRCFFILNNHTTLTAQNVTLYLSAEVGGGASIAIATDNIGPVAKGSAAAQAAQVADENTAPAGVSAFASPVTDGAGLAIGSLAPGQVKAVWVKRTAANSSPLDSDGVTFACAFDTAA